MLIIFHLTLFPVICKTKKQKKIHPQSSFQCQHGPAFSTVASKRGGHRFGSDTRPFCVSQCVFSHLCTSASSQTPKTYKNYIRPKTAERPPSTLQLHEQMHELMCTELWGGNIQYILNKHLLNLVYVEFIFISKIGHSGRCRMCF